MANPEHEVILRQGVDVWNQWRADNPDIEPDLSSIYIGKGNYEGVNLSHSNLHRACFAGCIFREADFSFANLEGATLSSSSPSHANFNHANFSYGKILGVGFHTCNWTSIKLRQILLHKVSLSNSDLHDCICSATVFISVIFSDVVELDHVQHKAKSIISVDSIVLSKGSIPDVFLRGCAVPEKMIAALPSLLE